MATKSLPEEDKFGLSSQMRRAAVSVPPDIAEGFRREYKKEFKKFLNISLGSLAELET
jgi:four helix bundle protein